MAQKNKRVKLGLALAVTCLVLSAVFVYASGGEGGHGAAKSSLSPEKLKDLMWRAMNFAALVVILVKFGSKPIANALGSRRMAIMTKFEDLNERRSEVEQTYKKYEDKLGRIDQEVKSIIDNAKVQAEAEREKIIADATRSAEDIKRKAHISVKNELAAAQQKLREDVADQAAVMAEELIRKNLTDADQGKLVEDYLDKVGAL